MLNFVFDNFRIFVVKKFYLFILFLSRDAFIERFDLDLNREKGCRIDGLNLLYKMVKRGTLHERDHVKLSTLFAVYVRIFFENKLVYYLILVNKQTNIIKNKLNIVQ